MTADNGTILKLFKGVYIDYLPARKFENTQNDQQIWITKERLLKHGIVFDPNIYRAFSNRNDSVKMDDLNIKIFQDYINQIDNKIEECRLFQKKYSNNKNVANRCVAQLNIPLTIAYLRFKQLELSRGRKQGRM